MKTLFCALIGLIAGALFAWVGAMWVWGGYYPFWGETANMHIQDAATLTRMMMLLIGIMGAGIGIVFSDQGCECDVGDDDNTAPTEKEL